MLAHYLQILHRMWGPYYSSLIILSYLLIAALAFLIAVLCLRRRRKSSRADPEETLFFLNNILESSLEYSIVALDLDGKILTWNAGARNNYGYESGEMLGRDVRLLYLPADLRSGRVQAFFDETLKKEKSEAVFERVRKNGELFIALVTMTLRRNAQRKPIGYLMISKDITEQKHLEEQLKLNQTLETQNREIQEANRLKNEFLANMSHELRTPLNAIIGFSELLYDQGLGSINSEQKESLGDIIKSAKLLLEIISDLLDLAKVESGKMEFSPQKINLQGLFREVLANVEMLFEKKRIHLTSEVDPELGNVYLDPSRLKQVLYNLISNALKFTPEFGSVQVRARRERDNYILIEVEDNGIGIRAEDLKKLFKSFIQLESGASKKYRGTGLGLVLTKQLVEAQNGRVGVFSTFGKGSTFYVILPREFYSLSPEELVIQRMKQHLPEPLPSLPRADGDKRPKVIVIDNDNLSLKLIQKWFKEKNYAVNCFSNPELGLEAVVSEKPDVLVLDLFMPAMNGFELLRRLAKKRVNKPIPVVIWTALDLSPSEKEKLDPSVRAVVLKGKPESTQAVLQEIEKILRQP